MDTSQSASQLSGISQTSVSTGNSTPLLHIHRSDLSQDYLLNPCCAVRIAGLPERAAAQLKNSKTLVSISECEKRADVLAKSINSICRSIEVLVHDVYDAHGSKAASSLIRLKRDLHNFRQPKRRTLDAALGYIEEPLSSEVKEVIAEALRITNLRSALPEIYEAELAESLDRTNHWLSYPRFVGALEIAYPELSAKIADGIGQRRGKKKDRALAASLNRLLGRGSLKTTPQSTLGLSMVLQWAGTLEERENDPFNPTNLDPTNIVLEGPVVSVIEPRHAAFHHALLRLLRHLPALTEHAPIKLAEVSVENEQSSWRSVPLDEPPAARTRGARYVMISTRSPWARKVVSAWGTDVTKSIPLSGLRSRIASYAGMSFEALENLLQKALDTGLIEVDADLAGNDDLLAWSRKACAQFAAPLRGRIEELIHKLEATIAELNVCGIGFRSSAFGRLTGILQELLAEADSPESALEFSPLVHEDCSVRSIARRIRRDRMEQHFEDLATFLKLSPLLAQGRNSAAWLKQEGLRVRFVQTFGKNGRCEDIVKFLLSYTEELRKRSVNEGAINKEASMDTTETPTGLAETFFSGLARAAASGDELNLDPLWIDALTARLSGSTGRISHCITGQLFKTNDGAYRFAVNQIYPGLGRMLTRFVPSGSALIEPMRKYLSEISMYDRYVEIPGTFGFNANRHARLADCELMIRPFWPDRRRAHKLDLSDLALIIDPATKRLKLVDANGEALEAFYLGLLMPHYLPPIHAALAELATGTAMLEPLWSSVARRMPKFGHDVVMLPRIWIGRTLLSRRTVITPLTKVPDPNMEGWQFFSEIQSWRKRFGLPNRVFYHRRDRGSQIPKPNPNLTKKQMGELMRKMSKPMPLDFLNPLSVDALQRSLRFHHDDLILVEAVPGPGDTVAVLEGEDVVTELEFELTLKER